MEKQSEIPAQEEWPKYIGDHGGFKVFQSRDGWHEAYRATGHAAAGGAKRRPKHGAHNGTSIRRIILPSKDYGEALKLLDAVKKKAPKE